MMQGYVEVSCIVIGAAEESQFDDAICSVATEMSRLEGGLGVAISGSASTRSLVFEIPVDDEDDTSDPLTWALALVRAASHAASLGTPGWPTVRVEELRRDSVEAPAVV
ncbi:hypothetical protein [Rathayibacter festucae]|uniref:hypothetical protein n=1 Tax=Rathayibacter festucae TaxID=110937 RepID=UPI002A69A02D|nr:hypothetical protein [Rathayibacter festucae]MDY0911311.1 hypothetical protein [Rathayibacter festucae]